MQRLVPHLWYDKQAKEAALFYNINFFMGIFSVINIIYASNH